MLQVTELTGFSAGGALQLKGYGYLAGTSSTANLALSYGTVSAGLAPAAGDLVAWIIFAVDGAGTPIVSLSGSGWAQSRVSASGTYHASILGKVLTAGDISSPPTGVSGPSAGCIGMWVAFSGNSASPSLSVPALAIEYGADGLPTNVPINAAGAAGVAVIMSFGVGTDDTPTLTWSGAVEDISLSNSNFSTEVRDILFKVATIGGGANVTVSKSDDGSSNTLAGGYLLIA